MSSSELQIIQLWQTRLELRLRSCHLRTDHGNILQHGLIKHGRYDTKNFRPCWCMDVIEGLDASRISLWIGLCLHRCAHNNVTKIAYVNMSYNLRCNCLVFSRSQVDKENKHRYSDGCVLRSVDHRLCKARAKKKIVPRWHDPTCLTFLKVMVRNYTKKKAQSMRGSRHTPSSSSSHGTDRRATWTVLVHGGDWRVILIDTVPYVSPMNT